MAARTLGSGPCTVSLLAILIAPGTVLPGVYAGRSASSGRRRAGTRPVYGWSQCALPGAAGHVYAVGSAVNRREACQSGRMGLTANELSPSKATGGSNPLASAAAAPRTTEYACARSSTDRASDYGSEGWGFESLRARSVGRASQVEFRLLLGFLWRWRRRRAKRWRRRDRRWCRKRRSIGRRRLGKHWRRRRWRRRQEDRRQPGDIDDVGIGRRRWWHLRWRRWRFYARAGWVVHRRRGDPVTRVDRDEAKPGTALSFGVVPTTDPFEA